jgi:hypothetical protein
MMLPHTVCVASLSRAGVQAKQWKMLADLEMDRGNLESAKAIFSKCLLSCYNVDLWMSYMRYIKQVRALTLHPDNEPTNSCPSNLSKQSVRNVGPCHSVALSLALSGVLPRPCHHCSLQARLSCDLYVGRVSNAWAAQPMFQEWTAESAAHLRQGIVHPTYRLFCQ